MTYLSIADAVRRTGASASAVRGWSRDGQVRSRTGDGPRGPRTEVAVADVERLAAGRLPAPPRPRGRRRSPEPVDLSGSETGALHDDTEPGRGKQLVPLQTVEAMERLSGELYLAGQRAARAEAVAEMRDRRLADLQAEAEMLRERNRELLERVAVAEAQLAAAAAAPAGEQQRWRRRRG